MRSLSLIGLLAAKDLRIEYRGRQAFMTTLFFGLLILVIFKFAFDPGNQAIDDAAPGILWVALLFPGIIQLNRSFQSEREEGTLSAIILAPVDRGVLFFGKALANWIFLILIDLFILGIFLIFYDVGFSLRLLWLYILMLLAGITFSAVGTLFAAMVSGIRTRDVLLPILLFPIMVPVIIGAVNGTREVLNSAEMEFFGLWLRLLIGCAVIFTAGCFLVFEYVIGD